MRDITNETLEKHMKRWQLKANVIAVISALLMAATFGYGFYYQTNSQLDQNTEAIDAISEDVEEINEKITNSTVFQNVNKVEMENYNKRLDRLENNQKRTEDKIDKVLEILAEKN